MLVLIIKVTIVALGKPRAKVALRKKSYFHPFTLRRNNLSTPGRGRQPFTKQTARRYERIRQLCPEDIQVLEERVQAWIAGLQ